MTNLPDWIQEAEKLAEKATELPWVADIFNAEPGDVHQTDRANVIGAYGNYAKRCLVRELTAMSGNITSRQQADAELIVHLVNNFPHIKAMAEALDTSRKFTVAVLSQIAEGAATQDAIEAWLEDARQALGETE